jgi:molybdenum cofactor biosynthesis enzyme MoaA
MCNARCIFCASYGEDSEKFKIPDEKLLSLVKELCDFSPEFINITGGGEPLLKKRSCY